MIVIYKIDSPSGRIYIGQSRNIELRLRSYRSGACHKQKKLLASIIKHGWDLHKFKVISELPNDCEQSTVNVYEQLYMDAYRGCGFDLLNIREAGSNGKHSEESKLKMKGNCGMHMIGRKLSEECIIRRTEKQRGLKRSDESKERYRQSRLGPKNPMFGVIAHNRKLTKEQVDEIRSIPVIRKYGHCRKIAERFGVSPTTISSILTNRTRIA